MAHESHRRCGRGTAALLLLASLLAPGPGGADGGPRPASCFDLERVTAFAPRGEVYVEVKPSCADADFARQNPILAYLEVLVGDLPPVGEDLRLYADQSQQRQTHVFRGLSLVSGDVVLVRIEDAGEIVALQSVKVP